MMRVENLAAHQLNSTSAGEYFIKVLNVRSQFDGAKQAEVRQRETDADLVPTSAEVAKALGRLKNGKAPSSSNILPEMLKAGGRVEEFTGMIADLVTESGKREESPRIRSIPSASPSLRKAI